MAKGPQRPENVDYSKFTDKQIKAQLKQEGMPITGSRKKLEARLKHCVTQAWAKYNAKKGKGKQNNKPKKVKKELSAAEKEKLIKQNEANRQAKLKRKAEHMKRAEEARERKRQKREAALARQNALIAESKAGKEERQKLVAYANIDMKTLGESLRKKLDPKGNKISSINFDFSKKGYCIKFTAPKYVETCTKGSTISKLTSMKMNVTTSLLPGPLESTCVYFLSPTALNHPNKAEADEWLDGKGLASAPELEKVNAWTKSALATFKKIGPIVNVSRERGFLVVQFQKEAVAKKFVSSFEGKEFNGVPFVFLKSGTPTKKDRNDCDEENPMPKKKKAKKE